MQGFSAAYFAHHSKWCSVACSEATLGTLRETETLAGRVWAPRMSVLQPQTPDSAKPPASCILKSKKPRLTPCCCQTHASSLGSKMVLIERKWQNEEISQAPGLLSGTRALQREKCLLVQEWSPSNLALEGLGASGLVTCSSIVWLIGLSPLFSNRSSSFELFSSAVCSVLSPRAQKHILSGIDLTASLKYQNADCKSSNMD